MRQEDKDYIVSELINLRENKNINDPRVQVYFQPIYDTGMGIFAAAEALVRLQTEKLGLLQPTHFINLAEKNECIHALSLNVLNKVCAEIKKMTDRNKPPDWISVNFSITELKNENFCDEILEIIDSYSIPRSTIAIELTETSNRGTEFDQAKACMEKLEESGIRFFLDDFGTGYSNLDRLVLLPFDVIKFDRTILFLATKGNNKSYRVISGLSNIFKSLDCKILFEGIETESDEVAGITMGADYLQGFLYSKPVPAQEYEQFLSIRETEGIENG